MRQQQFKRQTFFPVGCHFAFQKPIISILMDARNKHNVKYIRPTMSYHKFPNITELFQSDLNKKVMNGIISLDCASRACNCTKPMKNRDGNCIFNGLCRQTTAIYKVTCTTCEAAGHPMYYIGSTQNFVKRRCGTEHADDVCKLVNQGIPSDSFASHFEQHFKGEIPKGGIKPKHI